MIVLRRAVLAAALAIAIAPAAALGHHDRHGEAHHSLREAVTDQNFYFVMADRFNNGDPANDHGGLPPGKNEGQSGFDPTGKGWYHGGDLKGLTGEARLHPGPRDDRDLAHAELQEQGGPAGGLLRRLPRLLDHGLHADRPALRHQRRPADADRRRAPARHQGLLRHHHQPHRRRHQVRRGPAAAVQVQGPGAVQDGERAGRSTTATTPAGGRSRSWRRPASRTAIRWPR